jgi:hypothetical protein
VATLATVTATFCYVAFDLGLIDPGFIIYAPVIPALVVAIPVGILLGIARQRLGRAAFTILALLVSTLSGLALGEVVIGSSPHFSRERAIIFLSVAWGLFALVFALVFRAAPNTSLERTREG